MGNKPSTVNPVHWSIYERTLQIKDPADLARVAQSILTKPQLVNTAREHGVLGWLQSVASYQTKKDETIARLSDMVIVHPTAKQDIESTKIAFETDEKRRRREFKEASAKRHAEFLKKISSISTGDTAYKILGIKRGASPDEIKRAYRKAALATHPDKPGGSEDAFDKVSKAFASINEELKQSTSWTTTTKPTGKETYKATEHDNVGGKVAFGLLDPKKFDINMFNKVFEATKIEDPDDEGYEDWLKGDDDMDSMPVFSGEFNRALFNKMFDVHSTKKSEEITTYTTPSEICTASRVGHSELGVGRLSDYTSATGSGMHYTDLRAAFTTQTSLGTHDPRASEKMQRTTIQQYERERAAVLAKPITAEELEYERQREEQEVEQERERSTRLRERDNKYAALQDRMQSTRLLPDQLNAVGHIMRPALLAPVHPRALPLPAITPGIERLAITD